MNGRFQHVRWFRIAALGVALFAVFLIAIGASYWHRDTPGSEASCPICHVSHMPVLPGVVVSVHIAAGVVAWIVPAEVHVSHVVLADLDSPPRAPPA
jgi:hypothetical protein